MNIINENMSYIFIILAILASIILFYFNFTSVLNFKWYFDFYNSIDNVCHSSYGSKLEVEKLRYNIYKFVYNLNENNNENLVTLKNNFSTSFYVFISYYTLMIMMFIILSIYYNYYLNISIYIFLFIIYVTYTTTNSIIIKNFKDIEQHINQDSNNIYIYSNTYKILNAIMVVGNIQNSFMKYADENLNYEETTFDSILEKNISSSVNANNSSQVLILKQKSYDTLDFAKYFVLDKSSPFFVTYFEDIYIKLSSFSNIQFDISENISISELYMNRNNSSNYVKIESYFEQIKDLIETETRDTYTTIINKINNDYPINVTNQDIKHERISLFTEMIQKTLGKDIGIKQYNLVLYEEVNDILLSIQMILRNSQYNNLYEEVNNKILELFKQKQIKISVPDNDYIKYYVEHSNIIINEDHDNKEFNDIIEILKYQGDFIYSYVVYIAIIFFMISHYLYVRLNSQNHSFILIAAISLFLIYSYLSSVSSPL